MNKINGFLSAIVFALMMPALGFSATITSQASTAWNLGSTWVGGVVPGIGDDVIINGHEIELGTSTSVNSITISNALPGIGKLDINGNLTLNITGDLTVTATNVAYDVVLKVRSTSIVNVGGNVLMERTTDNVQFNELQLFVHDSGQLLISGAFDYLYGNGTEISLDVQIYDSAVFSAGENSSFQQEDGSFFTFNVWGSAQATFEKNLNITNNGGSSVYMSLFSGGGATINGNLTIYSQANTFDAGVFISTGSTLELDGDLTMTASSHETVAIDMTNTAKLYLGGNTTRTNNYGALDMASTSTLYFDGTSAQTVPKEVMPSAGNDAFNYTNIVFQNSSDAGLSLEDDMTITNHMTLTDGILNTSNSALLIVDDLATIDAGSASSYINGPMIKRGSTNGSEFTFPTGNNGIYAPITIEAISNATLEYTAQYIGCPPPTSTSLNSPLQALNTLGYWTLQRSDAASVGNISLHWRDNTASGISDVSSLVVAYYKTGLGAGWTSLGRGTTNVIGSGGSIKNDLGCPPPTVATLFALGSTDSGENLAPLPVEFLDFRAFKNNNHSKVFLEWETASEDNSDHFIIEKSDDGAVFYEIGRVDAAQNSTTIQFYSAVDNQPNKGNNYYRVQQVDQDNIMNFSQLVNVFINDQTDIPVVYPNPVKDVLRVHSKSLTGQEVYVKILDINGKCLYSNPHFAQDGQIYLSTSNMKINNPGIYYISYQDKGQIYSLKFMKM